MTEKEQLLNDLRIDRSAAAAEPGGGGVLRTILLVMVALGLGIGGTWWLMREPAKVAVSTATVRAV